MTNNKNLKLKAARTLAGMTQNDLAQSVNVSRQTIVAVESGNYNPSINLCVDICKVLGCTLDELFWQTDM
ncbi:transcriptional regulator [Leuconostoc citreum]|uniref:Putative transcription regulator n=1 Tax=Leuconostoc citreum TaxID=33964 RepID=A0A5A5U193_LEUCI|nr:helix-turn-helix transcriptional regulator [Leuconostoc citreum]MCP1275901.1 helix-turn-helix transcriptional regulator [Leuconostoc citreum]MCT3067754.1 transcriptional regulator [Leuconostoc citreum]OSP81939.1 transcriptional regulator [Leuconostoc citreum]QEA45383.1 helix-turn-helix transcriptional regulator [Leuconostoc citreum]QEA63764.1 helix-turn-helix transcriptional regulator [Leuconostoc citreum]